MSIDAIVFAGGGSRCFWQAGFYAELSAAGIVPRRIAAVSAGSAIACLAAGGLLQTGLELFVERTRQNPANVHWRHLLSKRPLFPHYSMYRRAILDVVDDRVFAELCAGPEIFILLAYPPQKLPAPVSAVLGLAAYATEKRLLRSAHPRLPRQLGFCPEVVRVRDCQSPAALADVILQSSCTPPFTPFLRRAGRPVIDGGVVDPAPVFALPEPRGKVLVLLTCLESEVRIPPRDDVHYACPSAPIPIARWDYANPDGLERAFAAGREDGARYLERSDRRRAA